MILLDVLKATKDRTVGSDKYQWVCFGEHAHTMDFKDADGTVYASAVFDITTQLVYSINIEVSGYQQAFLWIDPVYKDAYYNECYQRGIDPNIAWDEVNFTHVDTEELILEYLGDIGDTYYDNLPLPSSQIPTLTDEVDIPVLENEEMWSQRAIDENPPFTMPMPGTMGGAKFSFGDGFQNEKKTNQYKVSLTIQMDYDVEATSMDEAAEKARTWWETSKVFHGESNRDVFWIDRFIVEEKVSRSVEE